MTIKSLLISILLLIKCLSYIQFNIARIELKSELKNKSLECITTSVDEEITKKQKESDQGHKKKGKKDQDQDDEDDQDDQIQDQDIEDSRNYREICYEKDIAYVWPVYLHDQLYLMSLDTTTPISWVKGSKCHIQGSHKKCTLLQKNIKQEIKKIISKPSKQAIKHTKSDYGIIQGSSELVKGIYEKVEHLKFNTRDTSRLANLKQILLMGFWLAQQRQTMSLDNTFFINATQISQNINYLADGAISLRLDNNSQNSFLKQLFDYQNNIGKTATIFVHDKNGLVTLGDASTKHSQYGYGGIQWSKIQSDDKNYGKLPIIKSVVIDSENDQTFVEIHDKQYSAVLSLSASYVGLPKNLLLEWKKKLSKKAGCEINEETKYLECRKFKEEHEEKTITFTFNGQVKISLCLKDLILKKSSSKTILNLKETLHDTYAILGQPVFQKYLVLIDYENNKIGIAEKRVEVSELINVTSLIRFVCFVFTFGCSFILCFTPIKRCIDVLQSRGKYSALSTNETRRLKPFSPIQQNPYDQLNGQISEALQEEQ